MVATSLDKSDQILLQHCKNLGVDCYRGNLDDVLSRYYHAAKDLGIEHICRITADCPLIDPQIIDEVSEVYKLGNYDYVSNCRLKSTFPDGMDVEIFSFSVLKSAYKNSLLKSEREHVTPYIWNHPDRFSLKIVESKEDLSHFRLTVDEDVDYELMKDIFRSVADLSVKNVVSYLSRKPSDLLPNNTIERDEGYTKSLIQDLKILIVGAGSIGRRHIKNLLKIGCTNLVICDSNQDLLARVGIEFQVKTQTNYTKNQFDVAFICTPHTSHVPIAARLAQKKVHLFIEKPVSSSKLGLTKLSKIVLKNKLNVMVACNYRYHPGLLLLKKQLLRADTKVYFAHADFGFYLPFWHPESNYKVEYSAQKKLGGGVVLDRIHEIDYIYWLFGKPEKIKAFCEKSSDLEIDTEDNANAIFEYKNGLLVSLHLDYLQKKYHCSLKVVTNKGTFIWSFHENKLFLVGDKETLVLWQDKNYDWNSMYIAEVRDYLKSVVSGKTSPCDLTQGISALEIALKIKRNR